MNFYLVTLYNNMEIENEPKIIVCIGAPRRGKSYLIRSVIRKLSSAKFFAWGVCVTSTKFNGDYNYLPDNAVWDFDEERIIEYVEHLRQLAEEKKIKPNFLILDDLLGKIDTSKPFWQNFFATFRHTKTTIFFTSQYLKARGSSGTLLREITDIAFMFKTVQKNSIVGLFDSYGGMLDNLEQFKSMLFNATKEPFHCLCFKNNKDTVQESYCEFVADPISQDFSLKF
jgi:hypothetical protein